ncbi:microneme protein mic4 [Cystoisospora suis]|uniref:Microneme protein mic4 n=1 Tax=Cystoisospora suis TaxID=483139 RepID=A0A2C6KV00_9APIC|nr:microneme protein mic4 [Cystoisospora suis]
MRTHVCISVFPFSFFYFPFSFSRGLADFRPVTSFAVNVDMEGCCVAHRRGFAPAVVVLLVLAIVTSQGGGVYAVRQVDNAVLSHQQGQQQGSVAEANGGVAMVQSGLRSLHKHSAVEQFDLASLASQRVITCLHENIGSTAPDWKVKPIQANSHRDGLTKCQKECQQHSGCNHFTYNVHSMKCFLKNQTPRYRFYNGDWTASVDCDLNVEPSCFKMNTGSKTRDIKTLKMDPKGVATEIITCRSSCLVLPNCTHFTYNKDTRRCFLKQGNPSYREYGHDVSGSKDCFLGEYDELQRYLNGVRW